MVTTILSFRPKGEISTSNSTKIYEHKTCHLDGGEITLETLQRIEISFHDDWNKDIKKNVVSRIEIIL